MSACAALGIFYFSLLATSTPLNASQAATVARTVELLDARGFTREAFLLRHTAAFRSTDNWFNRLIFSENAYAATNFPFQVVTVYPDFFDKAADDTERAMVLLHEAQHMQQKDEAAAYAYVWSNRQKLGWTQLTHGSSDTFVTVSEQTREFAPELFSCRDRLWNDCTELAVVRR